MRVLMIGISIAALSAVPVDTVEVARATRPNERTVQVPAPERPTSRCHDVLAAQVQLDRLGFSPGLIDGVNGSNTTNALAAFQQVQGLPATGTLDCSTWQALTDGETPTTAWYRIAPADVLGPFIEQIPDDLVEQARLPALGYRSVRERLAERFHTSPELLDRLNPGATVSAGTSITVPAVGPFDPDTKPEPDPTSVGLRIEVRARSHRFESCATTVPSCGSRR